MKYTKTELAYIAVNAAFGEDSAKHKALAFFGGDPISLVENFEKIKAPMIKSGRESLYNSIKDFFSDSEGLKKEVLTLAKNGEIAVTLASEYYPEELKEMPDPPIVLYARGDVSLLKEEKFAVVGSRRTSPAVMKLTEKFSAALSEQFAVVTGIADGGDSAALYGAIKNGRAISVLPGGHGVITPSSSYPVYEETVKHGVVISMFPHGAGAKKYTFVERNAIIAWMSRGVLVVSAGEKSGALSTVNEALSAGKDVFAFPYGVGVESGVGCNRLIKDGAYLCDDVNDILSVYGKEKAAEESDEDLSDEEKRILYELKQNEGGLHLTELSSLTGEQFSVIMEILSSLEIKGKIVRLGGNRYSAV